MQITCGLFAAVGGGGSTFPGRAIRLEEVAVGVSDEEGGGAAEGVGVAMAGGGGKPNEAARGLTLRSGFMMRSTAMSS